jgi:glutamyl-tRNA reductase
MRIGVLGINHKSSELVLRETLAKACQHQFSFEMPIAQEFSCIVLSTCNRTEIYFSADDLAAAHTRILNCLREEVADPFEHKLYTYFGFDCFFHLAAVTAGLDSIIVGESEIQRQVKLAYEATTFYYRLPSCMHYLFQKSLKIGKQIRSQGPLIRKHQTLSEVIVQVGQWFFEDIRSSNILLIGNSEINRKTLAYLKQKKCQHLTLVTRGIQHAQQLAQEYQVLVYDWSMLPNWKEYDLIICGTTHSHYLLSYEEANCDKMKTKLIVDLSVPRTVDPQLARHPHLTLFNVEELGKVIDQQKNCDIDAMTHAEQMVWTQVQRQLEIYRQKESFFLRSQPKVISCSG